MKVVVIYTKDARKDLRGLEIKTVRKIITKIKYFSELEAVLKHAKKLKAPFEGLWRFRIGNYRAIFEIDNKGNITILVILSIKHRKDIY
ncbi:MAG TPA: type II toxin-antitoxin system RelE/ParE family toxin [Candidatus Yonathbacteria bacterium]|nr:type II toxin-antitoxin system RelE/ParE family toxin [Candidatus Yonathbacteria bacterium]